MVSDPEGLTPPRSLGYWSTPLIVSQMLRTPDEASAEAACGVPACQRQRPAGRGGAEVRHCMRPGMVAALRGTVLCAGWRPGWRRRQRCGLSIDVRLLG